MKRNFHLEIIDRGAQIVCSSERDYHAKTIPSFCPKSNIVVRSAVGRLTKVVVELTRGWRAEVAKNRRHSAFSSTRYVMLIPYSSITAHFDALLSFYCWKERGEEYEADERLLLIFQRLSASDTSILRRILSQT